MTLKIKQSSRHSKIEGDFGERLACYWLSRSGFETTVVDHTGVDIVAYDWKTKKRRLGITVKSRTREPGKETASVNIFKNRRGHGRKSASDRKKLNDACEFFACDPWLAIFVECEECADLYLTSLAHYDRTYKSKANRVIDTWNMNKRLKKKYASDPNVAHIHFEFADTHWPPQLRERR